ncbi:threonine dehydrogenase-like Zn-dependent dehydrogenase [Silvibacterium bohemicum]|uniref:Threonine dehydrogenase-like Zn-dependent dehydrogenase n=1 Tax=Silvibacterium bohemicum TaxID=1577686 RepID=A0A841JZP4_9BACT|nr:zinc-binding alcohol dehydrogenase family protein [Silvibacterium bohemicum]MBB6145847.1 threonine dehydrogenase-like Zn-dependent dehydrogenase [Silvibacterium bohemicum]
MKAFQIQGKYSGSVIDIPDLHGAAAGEVLLQVKLVGMCGTDLTTFRGGNPMVAFPRIPGHEVAATVIAGAKDLAPGTQATISPYTECRECASCKRGRPNACQFNQTMGVQRDGAMAEYISIPRARIYTANLSLEELCLVEPLTVGAHAASRGRIVSEDTVAVFGCGGIGLGAIASAAFRGTTVIAIDVSDAKLEIARKAGAQHLVNTAREDLHSRLQEITNGVGPDVMIEAIGLPSTFRAAVEEVAFTGRVVYIGYTKEPVSYETRLFVQKELDIMGSRNAMPDDFREVIRMLEAGRFPVSDAVSAIIPPEQAARTLAEWSANPGRYTKVQVRFNS